MDFRRKLSSGGESFSEGTSRFFNSVIAKKNGLMSDLSNKIESVGATLMKGSSSGSSLSDPDEPVLPEARVHKKTHFQQPEEEDRSPPSTKQIVIADITPIQKYQKDRENVQRAASMDRNQNGHAPNRYKRQSSMTSTGSSANEEVFHTTAVNMSFDEPLYTPSSKSSTPERPGIGPSWKGKKTPPPIPPPPYNPNKTGRRSSTNSPKPSSGRSSGHSSDSERVEKYSNSDKNIAGEKAKTKAPTFASTKRRSSTVDEMLFDDYVEPKPELEPEKAADPLFNKRRTLLPMGDLISFDEPELEDFHPKQAGKKERHSRSSLKSVERSFTSVSSTGSSEQVFEDDSEQGRESGRGLDSQVSVESSEPEYEKRARSDSLASWSSAYSLDSQPDDLTLECMSFEKDFVAKIFNSYEDISQLEKAKFGEYCQQVPGRQWFARYVNSQRVVSRKVDESIFFRLVQYFAVVLFECNEAEDFVPAKSLMNMCFTFYHEVMRGKRRVKNFLYLYLREQPIWQSLRFWNAAFFDAVQNERAHKPVCTSEDDHEEQSDDAAFQENITFGQLGTFTNNMRAFGLPRDLCLEFLRKQSTIANLKPDQIKMLRDNINKMKD
ncbi:uncharacterized protein LOC128243214 [Mya arenaria]|uniref:uncharacterized protein LOC128243214 n=1 Tax=Mya arenaria TaxID=6604 RepID=UPI0022E7E14D|nr:uncharacterized protein LOC128243214 [Mya arenaria]XP_052816780.1 uncharacterized protein LOC128243214 [Mya arenaria]XP_052816781.1 uncharacterized protein LOC128243214 [Mya arenaria]XP_052816783.1 uncharacterized protein LOC128243214 [Mya arenaria]